MLTSLFAYLNTFVSAALHDHAGLALGRRLTTHLPEAVTLKMHL